VSEATWAEVEGTFGGGGGSYALSSSASAYMLLYRRVDPALNRDVVPTEAVPACPPPPPSY
jgi:hypothetical protein